MVEEPRNAPRETDVRRHSVEHVKVLTDRFVVRRVETEAPPVLEEKSNGGLEIGWRPRVQLRFRFGKVLKVRRRPGQILTRTVEAQPLIPIARFNHPNPTSQVIQFLPCDL